MMKTTVDTIATHVIALESYNPFKGINPSFGPFKGVLESKVGMLLALAWALMFCYSAFHLITGIGTLSRGRKAHIADAVEEGKSTVTFASAAVMFLAALPFFYAALVR